jgi:hypothetical protein
VLEPLLKWILFITATKSRTIALHACFILIGMALFSGVFKCEDYLTAFCDMTQCSFVKRSFGCLILFENKPVSSDV